ncbi:PilZ domain-containing protein [Sphingobium sp. SCG-1]|uniref:PilZ domain-containing protein n=1 Tax=Sphingobium sp. SCG-1 TaxID=2072936 RepID=UPI0011AB8670|nr:PilZ domain-containing protein [Sphingobium sp. SCG-1]
MSRSDALALKPKTFIERAPRQNLSCTAEISGPTVPTFQSRVRNISSSGMLIDHYGHVSVGDVVISKLPGADDMVGTIVRVRDGTAGVRFLSAFDVNGYRSSL